MKDTFTIENKQSGQRLDIFCVSRMPGLSRAVIQKAIKAGEITVNNKNTKPNHNLKEGDIIDLNLIESASPESVDQTLLKLEVIYEDKDVVAINKPAGVLVHGHKHSHEAAVSDWLVEHYPDSKDVGEDSARQGIIHRLDRDSSGVLIMAKTQLAFDHLKQEFKSRRAKKEYLALVFNVPKSSDGRITKPISRSPRNPSRRTVHPEGKPAITEWKIESKYGKYCLIRLFPYTGRTHQLRVHMHHIGYPIVGDPLYTHKRQSLPFGASVKKGQLLHAEKLTIRLLNGKRKTIQAPLPIDFTAVLEQLE